MELHSPKTKITEAMAFKLEQLQAALDNVPGNDPYAKEMDIA